jgi:hypothetical protein
MGIPFFPWIDNDRVTVWDVQLHQGQTSPQLPYDQDAVILFLEGGEIRTVDRSFKASVAMRSFGDAVLVPSSLMQNASVGDLGVKLLATKMPGA